MTTAAPVPMTLLTVTEGPSTEARDHSQAAAVPRINTTAHDTRPVRPACSAAREMAAADGVAVSLTR